MKKKYIGDSEEENEFDVDEPEALQNDASDDEWTPDANNAQGRRQSSRLRSTPRLRTSIIDVSSSEDLSEDEDGTKKRKSKVKSPNRGRGRPSKKIKVSSTSSPSSPASLSEKSTDNSKPVTSDSEPTSTTVNVFGSNASSKNSKDYASGSFVVSKTDLKNTEDEPPIWKIDGKALLQKYVPFTENGKTLYRNTSVYSGWAPNNRDNYHPITVTFKQQSRKEHIVEFLKDQVKIDEISSE
uniref:Uncharacterized protein n=1 Tax=Clastoptera arizonana TaxID=38151 RepID=A0A1B6EAM2_9HEMI